MCAGTRSIPSLNIVILRWSPQQARSRFKSFHLWKREGDVLVLSKVSTSCRHTLQIRKMTLECPHSLSIILPLFFHFRSPSLYLECNPVIIEVTNSICAGVPLVEAVYQSNTFKTIVVLFAVFISLLKAKYICLNVNIIDILLDYFRMDVSCPAIHFPHCSLPIVFTPESKPAARSHRS